QPQHPFTLFNLGMTYAAVGEHQEAIASLRRSIANSGPGDSQLRKAYALLSHSLEKAMQQEEAWQTCLRGLDLFPDDAELLFRKAGLLHERGARREAAQSYGQLLEGRKDRHRKEERHFRSVVEGIEGFLARQNLAIVLTDIGELAQAE